MDISAGIKLPVLLRPGLIDENSIAFSEGCAAPGNLPSPLRE